MGYDAMSPRMRVIVRTVIAAIAGALVEWFVSYTLRSIDNMIDALEDIDGDEEDF